MDRREKLIIGFCGKKQAGKSSACTFSAQFFAQERCKQAEILNFADVLKKDICIKILGLTPEQCYGPDDKKEEKTGYDWSNFPDCMRKLSSSEELKTGKMSIREIMQVVGTEIFRNFFDKDIWARSTLRRAQESLCDVVLIGDVRFPGEIKHIIQNGGCIVRFTRDIFSGKDSHESETALDSFDWSAVPEEQLYVIDNFYLDERDKNECLFDILNKLSK